MKLTNDSVLGCDISYWQGNVDFVKMKKSGIKAVIIRAGYGITVDKRFKKYIEGAIAAGIKVGVYWFIYVNNSNSAIDNANKCISTISPYKDHIKLGVWADWEYDSDRYIGRFSLNPIERSTSVDIFCETIINSGYEVGIYSNQDYIQSGKFTLDLISKYPLWFARYSKKPGLYSNKGKNNRPYIWQYTSNGNGKKYGVSSSKLDLNKIYIDLEEYTVTTSEIPKSNNVKIPETLDYGLVFDPIFYSEKYSDLKDVFGNDHAKLLEHFLVFGINEGRQAHPDFWVTRYRDRYSDLQEAYKDNMYGYIMHYIIFGMAEGRKG